MRRRLARLTPPPPAPPRAAQACSAFTLAPGSAALLTYLLLSGNTPLTGVVMTPSLYWVVLPCAMADMIIGARLWLGRGATERMLASERRASLAEAAAPQP